MRLPKNALLLDVEVAGGKVLEVRQRSRRQRRVDARGYRQSRPFKADTVFMGEFSFRRSLFRFPQLLFNYNSKANQIKDCFAEDITLSIITA